MASGTATANRHAALTTTREDLATADDTPTTPTVDKLAEEVPDEPIISLADFSPVQLGDTAGHMVAVTDPLAASFIYVEGGALCVIPWDEAIKRFGPVKTSS